MTAPMTIMTSRRWYSYHLKSLSVQKYFSLTFNLSWREYGLRNWVCPCLSRYSTHHTALHSILMVKFYAIYNIPHHLSTGDSFWSTKRSWDSLSLSLTSASSASLMMALWRLSLERLLHSSNSAKPLFCALQQIILYLRIGTFNIHIISICNEGFIFSV